MLQQTKEIFVSFVRGAGGRPICTKPVDKGAHIRPSAGTEVEFNVEYIAEIESVSRTGNLRVVKIKQRVSDRKREKHFELLQAILHHKYELIETHTIKIALEEGIATYRIPSGKLSVLFLCGVSPHPGSTVRPLWLPHELDISSCPILIQAIQLNA